VAAVVVKQLEAVVAGHDAGHAHDAAISGLSAGLPC
jgi:hypothetical protein